MSASVNCSEISEQYSTYSKLYVVRNRSQNRNRLFNPYSTMNSTTNNDTSVANAEKAITPDVNVDAESHDIESTKNLIVSIIKDQSDNLEKAWREAISNTLDSCGSSAWLWYNENRTIITDDGDGIPLHESDKRKLMTHMGETSKNRSDDETIGQFGIGKGQYIAKGRVSVLSQDNAMHFDINNWGVEGGARQTPMCNAVEFTRRFDEEWAEHVEEGLEKHAGGFTIVISHYEEEVPSRSYKWNRFENQIKKRFKFTEIAQDTNVYVNDERISNGDIEAVATSPKSTSKIIDSEITGKVYIEVENSSFGDIKVYSNGVYVRSLNSSAFKGVIVTERNLDLNFARNEIKSGCRIWTEIENDLENIKLNICQDIPENKLGNSARKFLAERMCHDKELQTELADMKLFKAMDGKYHSYDEVMSEQEVAFADPSERYANRVSEESESIILSNSDGAVQNIESNVKNTVDTFDVEERAEKIGVTDEAQELEASDLPTRERCKLGVAQELADKLEIDRRVKFGEANHLDSWTDGCDEIVITESAAPSGSWNQYVTELYRTLIYESTHTQDTKENEVNLGTVFNREYRERMENNWDVLTEMIEEIDDRGIRSFKAYF